MTLRTGAEPGTRSTTERRAGRLGPAVSLGSISLTLAARPERPQESLVTRAESVWPKIGIRSTHGRIRSPRGYLRIRRVDDRRGVLPTEPTGASSVRSDGARLLRDDGLDSPRLRRSVRRSRVRRTDLRLPPFRRQRGPAAAAGGFAAPTDGHPQRAHPRSLSRRRGRRSRRTVGDLAGRQPRHRRRGRGPPVGCGGRQRARSRHVQGSAGALQTTASPRTRAQRAGHGATGGFGPSRRGSGTAGVSPHYLPVYGPLGHAAFSDPALAGLFRQVEQGSPHWRNAFTPRFLFHAPDTEPAQSRGSAPLSW